MFVYKQTQIRLNCLLTSSGAYLLHSVFSNSTVFNRTRAMHRDALLIHVQIVSLSGKNSFVTCNASEVFSGGT